MVKQRLAASLILLLTAPAALAGEQQPTQVSSIDYDRPVTMAAQSAEPIVSISRSNPVLVPTSPAPAAPKDEAFFSQQNLMQVSFGM